MDSTISYEHPSSIKKQACLPFGVEITTAVVTFWEHCVGTVYGKIFSTVK